MSWTPNAPNPCIPERLHGICHLYMTYGFANTCTAGCPYCFADPNHTGFERAWTYEQAIPAWRNVAEKYGPCFLLLAGLEPLAELPFVGELTRHHHAQACTNLLFEEDELYRYVSPERLEVHPSFHPHLWGPLPEAERFFAKVDRVLAHGYRMPLIALVGWPPFLPYWDEWCARIEGMGIMANCVPARMTTYQGQPLPDSYTEEQLAILRRHCNPDLFTEKGEVPPLDIVACAAGVATCGVVANGDVRRCSQVPGVMGDQNLYRDGTLTMLEEPLPCGEYSCKCNNLYPFHVTEARP